MKLLKVLGWAFIYASIEIRKLGIPFLKWRYVMRIINNKRKCNGEKILAKNERRMIFKPV